MKYSFTKTIKKTVVNGLIILIPVIVGVLPEAYLDMTLGGALLIVKDYLKHGMGVRLP